MLWGARLGGPSWAIATGLGVTAYGAVYFFAHDILVHRRLALRINPKRGYLRRLYQAHRLHHAVEGKDGCVSFGFVFAPSPARLKAQLKSLAALSETVTNEERSTAGASPQARSSARVN
jgi:beta-carotene 3-hydroxylase